MGRYSTRKQVDSHTLSDLIELPGGAFKMGSQQFYRCPYVGCQKGHVGGLSGACGDRSAEGTYVA